MLRIRARYAESFRGHHHCGKGCRTEEQPRSGPSCTLGVVRRYPVQLDRLLRACHKPTVLSLPRRRWIDSRVVIPGIRQLVEQLDYNLLFRWFEAALLMLEDKRKGRRRRITVGADKAYDTKDFIAALPVRSRGERPDSM